MNINYLNNNKTTRFIKCNENDVCYIESTRLSQIDFIRNAFSTRIGGVSKDIFSTMNLNFNRGDEDSNVRKNFELFAKAIGTKTSNMVYSAQTHTTNVLKVTKEDCGNGVIKPQKLNDIDGLITNEPGVCLVTTYADCVPLYFVDVKNKAIGLSHSGWRGTVNNIAKKTIELMNKEYGTESTDIVAFIGPSICKSCYEVGEDVASNFRDAYSENEIDRILRLRDNTQEKKYDLNLHEACRINILNAGVLEENISVTDICTCCNDKMLFSHRASKGKRGGLCAFLEIKE